MAGFFTGMPEQTKQFPLHNPQQQGVQGELLQQIMSLLQQNKGGSSFAPIEQNARRNFAQNTVPGIAERFTALGDGAQRSSAFAGQVGQASTGLESNLAALRSSHDQGQLSQLLGYGFQPSFENQYQPETQGFLGTLGGGASQGLGLSLPLLLGGYFGGAPAAAGASGGAAAAGSAGLGGLGTAGLGGLASNPALLAGGAGLAGLAALLYYLNRNN